MEDKTDLLYNRTFLRDWVLASILALMAGTVFSWYSIRVGRDAAEWLTAGMRAFMPHQRLGQVILSLPVYLATTTNVGAVVALCLALGQGWVLRKWVPWAGEWLKASFAGAGLSYIWMAVLNVLAIFLDPDPHLLKGLADSGLWIGVIMGLAQWRVLRKYTPHAFWWVVVSVGLWSAGSTLNHLWGPQVVSFFSKGLVILLRRWFGIRKVWALRPFVLVQFGMWGIAGALWGWIAGKVLARLLVKPVQEKAL